MLQLQNNSPFAAEFALFPDENGIDTLYVIVKATFKIGQQWSLTDEQAPIVQADEYWGEPGVSSIKSPSDTHTGKLNTDIIMTGSAFSPNGKTVQQLDVSLSVSKVNKKIRVFGDRQWQGGVISTPVPFQMMPLVYERAYGGQYTQNDEVFFHDSNPVGLGFTGKRNMTEVEGMPLPNLEDPNNLIVGIKDQPQSVGFSAIAPYWQPRCNYAGTYDENWQTTCAPFLPSDFDKRFCNVASQDLVYSGYLQGGELVEITNMHPQGNLKFSVPHVKLNGEINMNGKDIKIPFNLETLLLQPNDLTIAMVWRASINCDKKAKKISTIKINLAR